MSVVSKCYSTSVRLTGYLYADGWLEGAGTMDTVFAFCKGMQGAARGAKSAVDLREHSVDKSFTSREPTSSTRTLRCSVGAASFKSNLHFSTSRSHVQHHSTSRGNTRICGGYESRVQTSTSQIACALCGLTVSFSSVRIYLLLFVSASGGVI